MIGKTEALLKNGSKNTWTFGAYLVICMMLLMLLLPMRAFAAQLTSRSLALGSSAGNTATTWTLTFSAPGTTALNGIAVEVCTTPSGSCTVPSGWSNAGSAFGSLTYNGSNQTGWALDNAAGFLRAKNNSSSASTSNPIVLTFNNVTNPNTTNETFYGRVTTYTGDDFTGALDAGVVAASTAQQITVTAQVDESLTFCTGTGGITTSSCSGATGSAVTLQTSGAGNVSPSATAYGTSSFGVGTNANTGYVVTINGNTLTSGGNTISALGSQTISTVGLEQFGINLRNNATPDIGADPDGSGSGAPDANYNTTDQYRFVSGDTIASYNAGDLFRRYTTSYIANITTATEAGTYQTTLTYIATATF